MVNSIAPAPPTPAELQERLEARRAEQGITALPSRRRYRPALQKALARWQRALRLMAEQADEKRRTAPSPTWAQQWADEHDDLIAELGRHIARWGAQS